MRLVPSRIVFLSTLLALGLTIPASAGVLIRWAGSTITVDQMPPGSSVALVGAARVEHAYHGVTHTFQGVAIDANEDGSATWDAGFPLPFKTVVVGVVVGSGEGAVATLGGFEAPVRKFPAGSYTEGHGEQLATLTVPRPWALILMVRPAIGAWAVNVQEGAAGSPDQGADGQAQVEWTGWTTLAGSTPLPGSLAAGDTVLALAPEWLEVWEGVIP
ncbi:MAG TPA: hypothetical protein VF017_14650 [Thermoanaerobaculia bacterium]|nr:hypothetical protein [Thermoanaerobaculia bacterium]